MKVLMLVGILLLMATQVNAQFVCVNDRGEWYVTNTTCNTPTTLQDVIQANDEKAELKVRLAEIEAKLRSLQDAHDAFVAFQLEMGFSQAEINEGVGKTLDLIYERVK